MHDQMEYLKKQGRQVEIESDTIRKIIRETKELGTKNVLFIGGEPLLRKDLFELVSYAHGLGLNTIVVTNGVLLNEDNIKKCFDSHLDWLSISIDAATEESFRKIRGENVLGKIVSNIDKLNRLKSQFKKCSPNVVSVCTIMDDNLEELMSVVELCRRLHIARVLFQPVVAKNIDQTQRDTSSPGFVKKERFGVLDEAIKNLLEYKKSSPANFDFIGNSLRHLKLIEQYFKGRLRPSVLPCYAGYNRVQIVQEGKLYFCVSQQAYETNLGNIEKDSLKDLWFSKEAKFYRRLIRRCKSPCLQWCSYRDEFFELEALFQKKFLFKNK